jgi:HTH-type transcriptional regulator / antitoxin MqsA
MKDKCYYCGNETFEERLVSFTYEKGNKIFKIQNVPAKVCIRCEEKYFTAEISKSMQELINKENRSFKTIEAEEFEFD